MALCDEVTVLRDGQVEHERRAARGADRAARSSTAMLGQREVEAEAAGRDAELREQVAESVEPTTPAAGSSCAASPSRAARPLQPSRSRPGEIVGLAGVAGAGHHAVLELVSGLRRPTTGRDCCPTGARCRTGCGARSAPASRSSTGDRRRLGLMLDKPIWENVGQIRSVGLAADGPIVRSGALRERAREQVAALRIRSRSVDQQAGSLSRRQPAEGRVRQVAGRAAVGVPARRPHARRRRRRQGRDARADPLDRRGGRAGAHLLDRHRRARRAVRSRRGVPPGSRVGRARRATP